MTIKELQNIPNNGGATLRNNRPINYKTGYQVATEGIATRSPRRAQEAINSYNGNCGIWKENGVYYVDKSHRVNTKKEALEIGRAHNQISVLKWSDMSLIYCNG